VEALISIAIVGAGGALGAVARFWLSGAIGRTVGETFPWGTLIVNVSGAAAIGALAATLPATGSGALPPLPWLGSVTGFLGGYTTVSSYSLQTMNLARGGEAMAAAGNVAASVLLSLAAATAGFAAAATL
jgi:fluoride exporter